MKFVSPSDLDTKDGKPGQENPQTKQKLGLRQEKMA